MWRLDLGCSFIGFAFGAIFVIFILSIGTIRRKKWAYDERAFIFRDGNVGTMFYILLFMISIVLLFGFEKTN